MLLYQICYGFDEKPHIYILHYKTNDFDFKLQKKKQKTVHFFLYPIDIKCSSIDFIFYSGSVPSICFGKQVVHKQSKIDSCNL